MAKKKDSIIDIIKDGCNTYKHRANLILDGEEVKLVNRSTGNLHPFTNGKTVIRLNAAQIELIKPFLYV